jgi:hypothetical protein
MDRWAWEQLEPWLEVRRDLPPGATLCVIHGPTAGRRWEASSARKQLRRIEFGGDSHRTSSGMRTHSRWNTRVSPPVVIQGQLGRANLGITS